MINLKKSLPIINSAQLISYEKIIFNILVLDLRSHHLTHYILTTLEEMTREFINVWLQVLEVAYKQQVN